MDDREIDREIAEKVRGWRYDELTGYFLWECGEDVLESRFESEFQPSTNIDHAMEAEAKMFEMGYLIELFRMPNGDFQCKIWRTTDIVGNEWEEHTDPTPIALKEADTPAMAICLAALEAVKGEDDGSV